MSRWDSLGTHHLLLSEQSPSFLITVHLGCSQGSRRALFAWSSPPSFHLGRLCCPLECPWGLCYQTVSQPVGAGSVWCQLPPQGWQGSGLSSAGGPGVRNQACSCVPLPSQSPQAPSHTWAASNWGTRQRVSGTPPFFFFLKDRLIYLKEGETQRSSI